MTARVGIPSSLLYYMHFPMWKTFFNELNVEVVISGNSNKNLLDEGVKEALADACVPVKLYFGHALSLKDKVDYLFIPRVVCLNRRTIYCPKFLGLPDMIRYGLSGMPPVIDMKMDVREGRLSLLKAYTGIGEIFGATRWKTFTAYYKAAKKAAFYQSLLQKGLLPPEAMKIVLNTADSGKKSPAGIEHDLTFAVLGYPYEVHDDYISVGVVNKLKKLGVKVITMENLPAGPLSRQNSDLDKIMFWTFSDWVLRGTHYLFKTGSVDGIIHLTAFGCGPDSMVDKLMELASKKYKNIPFMSLTIDEHSGDAGVSTRLEAFTDMVRRKKEVFK
ncbi:(R)-2-hydroxyglutaryl-CoA dehydratase [Desulfocucumis palustris]|uniref:(R)-2-hydroxyglutaryl-CoA dehydratase n=1 Tax=Desulfocucumis palustris TaxID=1898651 RepID=A0A2L2XDV7_9FIRM|nr:acyl-CoA dehydratase activase-related protein [Desulfocucumis palustris]GBF34330.1 (R)-2-hydroxyglutaryl-CoA dehydratase [Desulfocucumis palustris]